MDFRQSPFGHRADQRAEMQRTDVQTEIAGEFIADRLEDAAVAAVAVDDQQIARRREARDLGRRVAQQRCHRGNGPRHGAGRPGVFARQADRYGRQLPQIERRAPARDDAFRHRNRDHGVRLQRQVRSVLLGRAERQTERRGRLKAFPDIAKIADDAVGHA
jgi:hypothetical protein